VIEERGYASPPAATSSTARRYGEAAETFARLVEHDPFLEAAHRGPMRCHMALGNRARAIRQYHELVELLSADIGTAPAPETTALYTKLRAPTPALAGAVSPVRK
jgi:DNA-binding SARP family transcriptional activator